MRLSVSVNDLELKALRVSVADNITRNMEATDGFSLIRLGDGEVYWALSAQEGKAPPKYRYFKDEATGVESATSTSGMETRHWPRFKAALEHATYLDLCNSIPFVNENMEKLNFTPDPDQLKNSSADSSNIIFFWVHRHFRKYLTRHRCLIVSSECSLLSCLLEDQVFRDISDDFFTPDNIGNLHLMQTLDDGRNYSENLDEIKGQIRSYVAENDIHTVFISLATGAKILCYELGVETGKRYMDFGSVVRAFTYSGAPGYQTNRSLHNPFFYRVPLQVFERALSHLHLPEEPAKYLSRIQTQIALDLQPLKRFEYNATDVLTGKLVWSRETASLLKDDLQLYRGYLKKIPGSPDIDRLDSEFRRWWLKKGFSVSGKLFLFAVKLKSILRLFKLTK